MHGQGLANQSPLSSVGSIYDSMPGILNMPLSEGTVNDLQPGSLPPFPGDAITQNDMGAEDFQELFASLDGVFLHAPGTVSQPVLVQPENIASSRVVSFASTVASPVTSSITSPITSLVAPPVAPWAVQNASKPKDPGASHGKHKTLFGAKGWLASTEDGRSPIRKKSVIKGLQHKFNLNFLKMVSTPIS